MTKDSLGVHSTLVALIVVQDLHNKALKEYSEQLPLGCSSLPSVNPPKTTLLHANVAYEYTPSHHRYPGVTNFIWTITPGILDQF